MYNTWRKIYMMNPRGDCRSVYEREGKSQREGKETETAILKCISHPPYSNQISQLRPKTSDMMDDCAAGIVGYFYLPHSSDFSASWQLLAKPCSVSPGSILTCGYNQRDFLYVIEQKDKAGFSECDLGEDGSLHMLRAQGHFDQHVARHKSFSIIDIVQVVSIRLWGGGFVANEALKEFPPPVGISYLCYLILRGRDVFSPLLNI